MIVGWLRRTRRRYAFHRQPAGSGTTRVGAAASGRLPTGVCVSMYGEGRGGRPLLHAADGRTGERVGSVPLPAVSTAPMSFVHEGRQYVIRAVAGQRHLGSLAALRLPGGRQKKYRAGARYLLR